MGLILFFFYASDLVDFCLVRSARRGGGLELLLAALAWRADGSVTTAKATTATLWGAMA